MNFLVFLLKLLNKLLDPATYKKLQQCKPQLFRLFSRIFGRNVRIGIAIALPVIIVGYGWFRMPKISLPTAQATSEITWDLPGGGTIPMGKITTTHWIDGGELVDDRSVVRFITHNNHKQQGCHILSVPEKLNYTLVLPDGTKVRLNAASRLTIPADFGSKKRELFLEGEGFFDIAPKAGQLLTIHSGKTDILALSTALDVSTYDNNVQVALAAGSIIVSAQDKTRQLRPGEVITVDNITGQMDIDTMKYIGALAWLDGRYDTFGKSMEEVKGALERWYGVTIVFDDSDFAKRHFGSAFFRNQPLDSFLNKLKSLGYLESYSIEKDGKLHLR